MSLVDLTHGNELATSHISTSSQKRIKERPALIADNDDDDEGIEVITSKQPKKGKPKPATPDIDEKGSDEHLKIKKQIEDLRKEYGDNWLKCHSASKVQDVMGIQVPVKASTETTEQKLENLFNLGSPATIDRNCTSTPIQELKHPDFAHSPVEVGHLN